MSSKQKIVRYYAKGGAGYLGSHVDGNFMTFLYSNGEGLQIPNEDLSIDPQNIKEFGVPSLTPTFRKYILVYNLEPIKFSNKTLS